MLTRVKFGDENFDLERIRNELLEVCVVSLDNFAKQNGLTEAMINRLDKLNARN